MSKEEANKSMNAVKQYMLDEIKAIRETRIMLKNKYPELFSSYKIKDFENITKK